MQSADDEAFRRARPSSRFGHSGAAGIAVWLNTRLRERHSEIRLDKHAPLVAQLKELVDAQYADGRTTSMGDDELVALLATIDPALAAAAR